MAEAVACQSCRKETVIPTSVVVSVFGGKEIRALVCPKCGDQLADILIKFVSLPKTN